MKVKNIIICLALVTVSIPELAAQTNLPSAEDPASNYEKKKNFIKLNLTAIILKNYSLQYERVLSKPVSLAIAFRTMPSSSLPFKNLIVKEIGNDDDDLKRTIENLTMSNFAITPEVRFYLSRKGYGNGFYIAPFYRYAHFTLSTLPFTYENILGEEKSINLNGKFSSHTGGFLIGVQKNLGKLICLDLWIFGPHFGAGKGDFTGTPSQPLTLEEQNDLRRQLDELDIPLTKKTVDVTATHARLTLHGPWAGLRSGISLGITF